uniref:hypothetical protein n=1 Tax=Demequina sp. TaxID=2050685 RepID=UPI0025D7153D
PFEIDGSTFAANTCARGGAIAAIRAPLIITGSSIVDNEASELGGGIFHQGFAETLEMSLSTVSGDGAPLGAGIAYDAPKGNLVVRDSRIAGNTPGAVSNTEFAGIHAVAAKIVVVRSDTD